MTIQLHWTTYSLLHWTTLDYTPVAAAVYMKISVVFVFVLVELISLANV